MTKLQFTSFLVLLAFTLATLSACRGPEQTKVTPAANKDRDGAQATSESQPAEPKLETETKLSEREVAEKILMLGGRVEVLIKGERQKLKAGDSLPQNSFMVVSCVLNKEFRSRDILMLKALKRLMELNLDLPELKDEDLAVLSDLPTLEYLKVGFLSPMSNLTNEGLRRVAECESLKKVGIGNGPNITGEGLSHISANPSIRSVTIYSNPHLTGEDFRQLTKSGGLNEVKLLHQPERPLPASKINALSRIPELYFHDCKLNDESIDSLCNLSGLKKAYFSYCTITPAQEEKLRTSLEC